MPIMLPPITRRQFIKGSLALAARAMLSHRVFAVAG